MKRIFSVLLKGVLLLLVLLLYGQETPTEEWVVRYNGPGNTGEFVMDMAVDSLGNIYVAGMSKSTWPESAYFVVAYDSDGNQRWAAEYRAPENYRSYANAIAIGPSGNVYVTGYSAVSSTDCDYATVAYDSDGKLALGEAL